MNQGESEPVNTVTIVLDNSGWMWYSGGTKDIESIKVEFFDCDSMIECVEI